MMLIEKSGHTRTTASADSLLSVNDYRRAFQVIEDCDRIGTLDEFRPALLDSLARRFGYRTTTFFHGTAFSTLWLDPEPLQTGKAIGMLGPYRDGWYQHDIFATAQARSAFARSRVATTSELSNLPPGASQFLSEYLYPATLHSAAAFLLDVSGDQAALVGIFSDRESISAREVATLRVLARPLNALTRALRPGERPDFERVLLQLTPRQREVAYLVADGLSNISIAELLWVSEDTVKKYVSAVLAHLGCESRTQLALFVRGVPPTR
jgi:DNA-binding CsgD family transcriptional regulator